VSVEVAGWKAENTQSSGTLSITAILGWNNGLLIWKPELSLYYFRRYQKFRSEEKWTRQCLAVVGQVQI
jgi:hypothetical protein